MVTEMDQEQFDQLTRCRGCFFRNSSFEPKFCFERFVLLAQFGHKYPSLAQDRMADIISTGLMSLSSQGNYDLYFPLWKEKSPFPLVDGKRAFFVLKDDAEFARRAIKKSVGLGVDFSKMGGEYIIPEIITPHDWAVIRIKAVPEKEPRLLGKLVERGILSRAESGNYSALVKYDYISGDRSKPSVKDMNLRHGYDRYYFVNEDSARQYLDGVCSKGLDAEVVKNK